MKTLWSALCTTPKRQKVLVFRQTVGYLLMIHHFGGHYPPKEVPCDMSSDWKVIPLTAHHPYFTEPAMTLQKEQLVQEQFVNIFTCAKHSNPKLVLHPLVLRYCCLWLEVFMLPHNNFQSCLRDYSPVLKHTEV